MPAILHTADVHLGKTWSDLGSAGARLAELHWDCFERTCRMAVERGAVALVIAGDLFERPDPPAELVQRVSSAFKRLKSEGVAVVVAPGTHDAASAPRSVYREGHLGGARVFLSPRLGERFVAERGGSALAFSGLAWDPQETPREFLADYSRGSDETPEVLVLHAEVGGKRGKRPKDLPASPEELSTCGADYVALGHRHEHREFKVSGGIWGAYPGTPFGLSFRSPELEARSACLVSLEAGEEPRVERLSTSEVLWLSRELDVDQIDSAESLAAAARALVQSDGVVMLRLRGAARFAVDADALGAELAGDAIHLEIEDSSVEIAPESLEQLAEEQSVRGIFARRMLERLSAGGEDQDRAETAAALREGLRALAEEG